MSGVQLYLDNTHYCPGNVITGKAVCFFRSVKEIRQIRIRLKGNESTHWTGTETYYETSAQRNITQTRRGAKSYHGSSATRLKTKIVHYNGHRDFLLRDLIVHEEGTIGKGEHVFPFEFVLPEDLPGSFHHEYGKIVFSVKVTVERSWKTDFHEKKIFTMIAPIKLHRLIPSLQQPAKFYNEKSIGFFCCTSGPVQLEVQLNKKAFVVGEAMGIKVYIKNLSNSNVESLSAELKMKYRITATSPRLDYKYASSPIFLSHETGVGAHGDNTYNLSLVIPATTLVPNFTGCALFECFHQLKVTASIAGLHSNLSIETDVAVGHVPYPEAPFSTAQYPEAPPYAIDQPMTFQPMPMAMSLPGYDDAIKKGGGGPTGPVPGYPPTGPSAPHELEAPSAPSKLEFGVNNISDPGRSVANKSPPPAYDEAEKY